MIIGKYHTLGFHNCNALFLGGQRASPIHVKKEKAIVFLAPFFYSNIYIFFLVITFTFQPNS